MLQAATHPSVILYTLGCELNASIGADILSPLFEQTKQNSGDALVRDNSGGGDAYGGLLNEHAEFYDYHFYSDLQFFRPLLDYYALCGARRSRGSSANSAISIRSAICGICTSQTTSRSRGDGCAMNT